jgi:signal peptidase I
MIIVGSMLVLLVIIKSIFLIVEVIGTSMVPNILPGDRLIIIRRLYRNQLKRGQVVLVRRRDANPSPRHSIGGTNLVHDLPPQTLFIKRILGVPGERGQLHINEVMPEFRDYVAKNHDAGGIREWLLTDDQYYVRGDSIGIDSSIWGPISQSEIVGVVVLNIKSIARKGHRYLIRKKHPGKGTFRFECCSK